MRYRPRDAALKVRIAICALMAGALALAYPAAADELGQTSTGTTIRCAGRTIVLRDPQQVDVNVYWFALDPLHASYATTLTTVAATAASVPAGYGTYAVTAGANGYTGLNIVGPVYGLSGLSISASGVCRDIFNYICSKNPNYAAATYETDPYTGAQFRVWGKFIQAPQRIPTTGEDLRLAIAKGAVAKTVVYVSRNGSGTGSGNSYLNAASLENSLGNANTVNPALADCLVLCGDLIRDNDWGVGGSPVYLYTRANDANSRLQIISHPIDRARMLGLRYAESTSTIGTWTSIGSGTWQLELGGSVAAPEYYQFCFKYVGGVYTPLTTVASVAACQALADSFYPQQDYSGSNDRVTVHLADGSNPNDTFVVSGGIYPYLIDKKYFDVYGIDFPGNVWLGSGAGTMEEFAFYTCGFGYTTLSVFAADNATINEATGAFAYRTEGSFCANPNNRKWIGCYHRYGYTLVYDNNNGHGKVPTNTTIRDNYFYRCNGVAADNYGFNGFSASDQHQITGQGADGWDCVNNRSDECGNQSFLQYLQPNNFAIPTGLESTDFYTTGVNYPNDTFSPDSDVSFTYGGVCRNVRINYNYITNPRIGGAYSTAGTQAIAVNGDNGQCLGRNGNYGGIEIAYNRVHCLGGGEGDQVIRCMLSFEDGETNTPHIHHNTVRADTSTGFFAANTVPVTGPITAGTYEPSFRFYDNDIQSSGIFIHVPNVANPAHHIHLYDRNTYRGTGEWWQGSGTEHTTIAAWRAAQASGDVHDPNSMVTV